MSESNQPIVSLSSGTPALDATDTAKSSSTIAEPAVSEGNGEVTAGTNSRKRGISPIEWTGTKDGDSASAKVERRSRSRSPQQAQKQAAAAATTPPPEQPSKLRYLFRDARYFMVKSSNYENVSLAKAKGVWATPPPNENRLNTAYNESRSVFLIFSVKESGRFQGYARLAGPSEKSTNRVNWVLPPGLSHRALSGTFRIDWISRQDVHFSKTGHLLNAWNEFKPVKIGRDGQEIEPKTGEELCRLFTTDPACDIDRLIDRSRSRRRAVVPPTAPTMGHHHFYQHGHQHHHHHQSAAPPPVALEVPVAGAGASASHHPHPPPIGASAAASQSSSSSRRRRRSSGGGGRSGSRRSRSPPAAATGGGNAGNVGNSFQGVGKETFINGSYQDYLRQFGSAAVQPDPQQQHVQQQMQPIQAQQQYQQYPGYSYPYAAQADPYAMMYGQQYMMPGQQQMYDYQQYQLQQQQQQQQLQQQQMMPQLSAKEYEQRVNEFIQRTNTAPAPSAAAATAVAAIEGGGGGGSSVSASSDSSRSSSGHGGSGRRRRRSSSRR